MDVAKNFAKATLSQGYESTDTTVDVLTGEGARFPNVPFNAVWWNATDFPDPSDDPVVEIVRVTDTTDDTLTITRGQEGTAAEDHNLAGKTYKMIAGLTALTANDLRRVILPGPDGAFFGDVLDNGNSTKVEVNDTDEKINLSAGALISLNGKLSNDRVANATTLGSVVKKLPLHDSSGTIIGYVPIYDSIT